MKWLALATVTLIAVGLGILAVATRPDPNLEQSTRLQYTEGPFGEGTRDVAPVNEPPLMLAVDRTSYRDVQAFLDRYCVSCHDESNRQGNLRLDELEADLSSPPATAVWTEIMHRMNAGEMPPKDALQPDVDRLSRVAEWIAAQLSTTERGTHDPEEEVVLRRLTRFEYNNTIRDLVGIDFQPADRFPEDPSVHGFDGIGAAQHVSPLQIEQYVAAARDVLDRAVVSGSRPKAIRWHFESESSLEPGSGNFLSRRDWDGEQVRIFSGTGVANEVRNGMLVLLPQRGFAGVRNMHFREGEYVIRVRAAAEVPSRSEVVREAIELARRSPDSRHEFERLRQHYEEDLLYQYGPARMKVEAWFTCQTLVEVDVAAPVDEPRVYEFRVRLPEAQNGVKITNNYHLPGIYQIHRVSGAGTFPQPRLLIDWIEIEGPTVDDWPLPSQQRILFPSPNRDNEQTYSREVLAAFMTRAWRRPVTAAEIDEKLALFNNARRHAPTIEDAIKIPLIAVLSSPHFLFRAETEVIAGLDSHKAKYGEELRLSSFELASRLSYFLWSSMPDEELLELAAGEQLFDEAVLLAQVDRMLADAKSQALAHNFAGQWLGLGKVGTNPPSSSHFRRYDAHLQESMICETEGFFAEILDNDLDVRNFIRSDFVTINERLARFYGIANVRGDHIRRVAVPEGAHRGGLVTQGSILTITSNGTRTSPVLRGKWILDNILGTPPSPPPPNAGEIAQQVPGLDKVTVRKRLEIHRQIPACAACHDKIDPLGFALENFRGDGSWAEHEGYGWHGHIGPRDPVIDTRATLPGGQQVDGVEELQQALLQMESQFLHCLTRKLATYALGRGIGADDQQWLNQLVQNLQSEGRTLRGLIKDIVKSESFQTKRIATVRAEKVDSQ